MMVRLASAQAARWVMSRAGQSRSRSAYNSGAGPCNSAPPSSNRVSASRTGPRAALTPCRAITAACKAFSRHLSAGIASQAKPLKKSCRFNAGRDRALPGAVTFVARRPWLAHLLPGLDGALACCGWATCAV